MTNLAQKVGEQEAVTDQIEQAAIRLSERVAALEAHFAHIAESIERLNQCVEKLSAAVSSFKGAIKLLVFLSPPIGAGILFVLKYLL